MKHLSLALTALFCQLLTAALNTPAIRFTDETPFKQGKRCERAWKKADRLTRFLSYRKLQERTHYDFAVNDTQAELLFDDTYLYLSLTAKQPTQPKASNPQNSIFSNNNFEIFLRLNPDQPYFQLAIDDLNRLYVSCNKNRRDTTGIKSWILREQKQWTANLAIPFSCLDAKAPQKNCLIKAGIMRNNLPTLALIPEASTFTPTEANYHLPELWADMILTRENTPPKTCRGICHGPQMNLIPNPDFNHPVAIPNSNKPFVRQQETMVMSGEWILRATGEAYPFYACTPQNFKTNTNYTLVLKARNFGGAGSLGVIQHTRDPQGNLREGKYIAWNMPLNSSFNEYFINFKSPQDTPRDIAFFKLGPKRMDCGVDLASVRLYEGKISACQIRKLNRGQMLQPVPGTEQIPTPNPYGKRKDDLRVLAFACSKQHMREIIEIFAGMNVTYDILVVTGKDQDIYETDGTPQDIEKRLAHNHYNLIMLGARTADHIGKEMFARLAETIKQGTGLWLGWSANPGRWEQLLAKANMKYISRNTYPATSFPENLFRTVEWKPVNQIMRIGNFHQGRIAQLNAPIYYQGFKIYMQPDDYGTVSFPYADYADAWMARLAYFLAAKDQIRILKAKMQKDCVTLTLSQPKETRLLKWEIIDKTGTMLKTGQLKTNQTNEITVKLPQLTSSGPHLMVARILSHDNLTQDCCQIPFTRQGPQFINVKTDREAYESDQKATLTAEITGFRPGMTGTWELLDFSGRILDKGDFQPQKQVTLTVPLTCLYTNMGRLRLTLKEQDSNLDSHTVPIYVRDLDRKRIMNDFTAAVWPVGNGSMETMENIAQQLEKIGFRHSILPLRGVPAVLKDGFSSGNCFLGGGEIFCGWPQENNIRKQQFNTKKAHQNLKKQAENISRKTKKYGVLQTALCDEPNFNMLGSSYELDAHPENLAVYRQRMQLKYKTIQEYNRRHLTSHQNFQDLDQALIADARKKGVYAEFIEWRNFNVDRWCEAIRIISDAGRTVDPHSKFSLYNSFGQGALSGNDYWKLLTKAGLEISNEYTTMAFLGNGQPLWIYDEFYRSFRPDMRVWGFTGYYYYPGRAKIMPWWFAAHRFGGFTWFAAYSWNYNLIDMPSNALTVNGRDLMQSLEESKLQKGLGKALLDYPWRPNDVAIYYSHDSMLLAFAMGKETKDKEIRESGYLYNYFYSRQGIQYALEELLWQYDYVAPEQVIQNKLKDYKVLFMPSILALSQPEINSLKDFIRNGGKIIADSLPGTYDELGVKRKENLLTKDNIILFNQLFDSQDKAQKKRIKTLLMQANAKPILDSNNIVDVKGREAMHFLSKDMNIFVILRALERSNDKLPQTFELPTRGHLYDLRKGRYLGVTNSLTATVPYGDAVVYGLYPYRVKDISLAMPSQLPGGNDLKVNIAINPCDEELFAKHVPQRHVFHVEVLNPKGKARFHMKRNLSAPDGKAELLFRMAHNDPKGTWTLRVTDVMTGMTAQKCFTLL